ncbi:MAG: hypothetical protein JXQ30_02645 [Spirochaetes bacterium]|nr:hypothetical protein [Spirochaetota bacterium]
MKKIVLISVVLIFIATAVFAQDKATDAGSIEFDIGSIVDVTIYTGAAYQGDDSVTDVVVGSGVTSLNCSYFIIDNLAVGGKVFYESYKVKGNDEPDTILGLEPVVSYYAPLIDKLYLRTYVGMMYISVQYAGYTESITQVGFDFSGGVMYLVTPHLGIYGGVTYATVLEAEYDGQKIPDSAYEYIDFDIGFSVFL